MTEWIRVLLEVVVALASVTASIYALQMRRYRRQARARLSHLRDRMEEGALPANVRIEGDVQVRICRFKVFELSWHTGIAEAAPPTS